MSSHEGKNRKHKKDSDSDTSSEEEYKKDKTHKKKKHKRRRSLSNSSDSEHRKKKHKSEKDKKHKKKKKKDKRKKSSPETVVGPEVPEELLSKGRNMAPMTKEEWEKQQSVVKRVYDPETGRHRLVKGTGEILEEIVSKDMHKEINKQATLGDGNYFQTKLTNLR